MMKALKAATSARHAALEARLPLLRADLSLATYQHYVQRLFGFYQPLEHQLAHAPGRSEVALDYASRQKTPRLLQDLQVLGDSLEGIARLPRCTALPPLTTAAQLWGCLYVIEGASLGGQIILRQLHAHLGLTVQSGASFFDGYGRHTAAQWKAFCAAMPLQANQSATEQAAMLVSANCTFELLGDWLFSD